ncbi:unnamed protein product [Sphagnum troendelagicum]
MLDKSLRSLSQHWWAQSASNVDFIRKIHSNVTHPQDEVSSPDDPSSGKQISKYWILVVVIVVVGVLCLAGHALVAYCLWHHKQRKEEQAQFVQLFEDDESLEEEQDLKDDL